MPCPRCGQANAGAALFCITCGEPLSGERRDAVGGPDGAIQIPIEARSHVEMPTETTPQWSLPVPPDAAGARSPAVYSPYSGQPTEQISSVLGEPYSPYPAPPATQTTPYAPYPPQSQPQPSGTPYPPPTPAPVSPYPADPPQSPPAGMYRPVSNAPGPASMPAGAVPPAAFITPCRVCGNPVTSQSYACKRCGTPAGMVVNPNDSTASTYLPIGQPAVSSGQPAYPGLHQADFTPTGPAARWNWGAAFLTYFWAAAHRIYWYVALQTILIAALVISWVLTAAASVSPIWVGLITIVELMIWIPFRLLFGFKSAQMGMKRRNFESLQHYQYVQEVWKPFGIVAGILSLLVVGFVAFSFFLGIVIGASMPQ